MKFLIKILKSRVVEVSIIKRVNIIKNYSRLKIKELKK